MVNIHNQNLMENILQIIIKRFLKNYDSTKGEPTTHFNFYILGEMNTFISEFVCCANHYYRKQIKIINEWLEQMRIDFFPNI